MYSIVYWKKGERVNQRLAFYPVERKGFWENLSTRSSCLFPSSTLLDSERLFAGPVVFILSVGILPGRSPLTRSPYIGN